MLDRQNATGFQGKAEAGLRLCVMRSIGDKEKLMAGVILRNTFHICRVRHLWKGFFWQGSVPGRIS